jgi:uncharacterized protein YggE
MRRSIPLMLVLLAAPATALAQAPRPADPPSIVTRGTGTVKRAPDQAWVSIAAETRATAPGEAQRLNAEAMTAVQAALKRLGLAADAVKTTGYSLSPDTEWVNGRARIRGYIARNQIEVRVDALDRLSSVLDAAGASGATTIAGIRFDLRDRELVEREALRLAVEDALARARAVALGARASVGAILRIVDEADAFRPMPAAMRGTAMEAAAAPPTPISPGEIEITATVMVTVEIR